ncbi:hypothetical protein D3C73_1442280 [compost metagenome]
MDHQPDMIHTPVSKGYIAFHADHVEQLADNIRGFDQLAYRHIADSRIHVIGQKAHFIFRNLNIELCTDFLRCPVSDLKFLRK